MSRKKAVVKGGPPMPMIRENSRLMRTHESMVDFINGRTSGGSFLDAFAPALFGLRFPGSLEDDLIYTDDEDDDDVNYYCPQRANKNYLEPHPQLKQLTDEEADKIAKELIDEEERRKGKTEKNKRKKQRKKEKKRLEKENAPEENLPDVEKDKCDSKDQDQNPQNCSNSENKECFKLAQPQGEEAGCKKNKDTKEKDLISVNKKEKDHRKGLNLNNSCGSAKSIPEKCEQMFTNEKNKNKNKVLKIKEEKPEVPEKPELQREEDEASKKKTVDPAVEEFAKRSIELASVGNRLAASGQYETAVSCFTDAIKYNPKEFKLFGNRSLCYERLQQYENALRDANLALSMEPKWIKGLFRKGKALCGLKRYYEASLIYKDVLKLESTSAEAAQELKRAQTLHLMEMGFSWAQSLEALKTHGTLEEAVEALFARDSSAGLKGAEASWDKTKVLDGDDCEDSEEGEWIVQHVTHLRQHSKNLDPSGQTRSESQSPTPHSRSSGKPKQFSVWVGTLAPTMTYVKLYELFSRAGTVYSIKMLLEQQCAFVNYTRKEDCDRAIQCIDGMVVEGAPLTVRHPHKFGLGATDPGPHSGTYKKECFFWRTIGCTREDCTFRHVPEHKNLDKDKFTSRLGYFSHVGDHK